MYYEDAPRRPTMGNGRDDRGAGVARRRNRSAVLGFFVGTTIVNLFLLWRRQSPGGTGVVVLLPAGFVFRIVRGTAGGLETTGGGARKLKAMQSRERAGSSLALKPLKEIHPVGGPPQRRDLVATRRVPRAHGVRTLRGIPKDRSRLHRRCFRANHSTSAVQSLLFVDRRRSAMSLVRLWDSEP